MFRTCIPPYIALIAFLITPLAGVLPRSIGIAPEKALKMGAWEGGISLVNYAYPECPKSLQWMFAGSMAGAATTIIGELVVLIVNMADFGTII